MKKHYIFATVLSLFTSALLMGQPDIRPPQMQNMIQGPLKWETNFAEALKQSKASAKPILLLFTGGTWCPACIQLERQVLTHPEFAQQLQSKFVFFKADFPNYTESSIANSPYKPLLDKYRVNAYPTMIVIDSNENTLFNVNYQSGGVRQYVQEFLQKLSQFASQTPPQMQQKPQMNQRPMVPQSNDGYYDPEKYKDIQPSKEGYYAPGRP